MNRPARSRAPRLLRYTLSQAENPCCLISADTPRSFPMDQRVAVITGAAQGIGRHTAELLADRGYAVAIIDVRDPSSTAQAIEAAGAQVLASAGDIIREETVAEFARQVLARFGRADVLVNNAGISLISPAEETSFSDY